ncbi:hypothetical protein ACJVC5_08165 [Peredibacter sp. HCB2-198]|uniref:hypothetical protein n=1 Tax=Peredibacter sp. HCB2-198 TaxID=3383025 RepID=UPI0038B66A8F
MFIKHMALLFFLTSCALFKSAPSLKSENKMKLLDAVRLTGEGRGRLTLGASQYVFSFESLMKENTDWLLAVSIPLHGEEVMILPELKQKNMPDSELESFEARIDREFDRLKLDKILTSEEFLKEFRSLVRFNLAKAWGQKPDCAEQGDDLICELDGEKFLVKVSEKDINIIKLLGKGRSLVLNAQNLTNSIFDRTDIRLYSSESHSQKKESSLSLELFWQN